MLVCMLLVGGLGGEAKVKSNKKRIPAKGHVSMCYYIVCGSYSSLEEAIKHCDEMSEVVFYEVFEAMVEGKTVYRVCCDCYTNRDDAEKDLEGIYSSFKSDDWWIWTKKNKPAKCVYRPLSPADGETRIPVFEPRTEALTD